ncbi:MAG TPA: hypothetical protein VGJ18_12505 [Gemmatimonadaceae bacterium]|jgi:hypothetical protein
MADESKQRLHQDVGHGVRLGDDQGTRVGSPTPGAGKKTGAGSEATEGMHSADGERAEGSHDTEHRSQYGGGSRPEDDTSK